MRTLGLEAKRCHSYETEPARKTKFMMVPCGCSAGCKVSSTVYFRILRDSYRYDCKVCGWPLTINLAF